MSENGSGGVEWRGKPQTALSGVPLATKLAQTVADLGDFFIAAATALGMCVVGTLGLLLGNALGADWAGIAMLVGAMFGACLWWMASRLVVTGLCMLAQINLNQARLAEAAEAEAEPEG